MDLSNISSSELFSIYSNILEELTNREVITTKNLVGEMAEYLVIEHYKNNSSLPNLQKAPPSTKNIDAISSEGKRYSIKSTSTGLTSVFHSVDIDSNEQQFEFLVVLKYSAFYKVEKIIELHWNQFVKFRRIKKPEMRYAISLNSEILKESNILYERVD